MLEKLSDRLLGQLLNMAFLKWFLMGVYMLRPTFKFCYKAYCTLHKQF